MIFPFPWCAFIYQAMLLPFTLSLLGISESECSIFLDKIANPGFSQTQHILSFPQQRNATFAIAHVPMPLFLLSSVPGIVIGPSISRYFEAYSDSRMQRQDGKEEEEQSARFRFRMKKSPDVGIPPAEVDKEVTPASTPLSKNQPSAPKSPKRKAPLTNTVLWRTSLE